MQNDKNQNSDQEMGEMEADNNSNSGSDMEEENMSQTSDYVEGVLLMDEENYASSDDEPPSEG